MKNFIPILMYHSIQSEPKKSKLRGLSVPTYLFKIQLFILKLLGYQGLSMSGLMPYLKGEKTGKVFGITFDDGYLNNYQNALKILLRFKYTATCYIVSNNIGGINHWDLEKGVTPKRMMNELEIKNWINKGMEIGSHSLSHVHLTSCNSKALYQEVMTSRSILEEKFNVRVDHFCYPYGDTSKEIVNLVENAGYKTAVTVVRGRAKINSNFFELPRVLMNHRTYPQNLFLKFFTNYESKR